MPIGSAYWRVSGSRFSASVIRCLGTLDLHTHIRLRPIRHYFRRHVRADSVCRVLEIGCGDGVNAFELDRLARQKGIALYYRGIDLDAQRLGKARQMAQALGRDERIEFLQMEAQAVASLSADSVDLVILADILEHLHTPQTLLEQLRPVLTAGSTCLVSVPTPNYSRFFGAAFHRKVGHVKDGYRLEELNTLFAPVGGRLIEHCYSTGMIANLGCAVYYHLPVTRMVTAAKALLLAPFRFMDLYNSPAVSCSLFAVYVFDD